MLVYGAHDLGGDADGAHEGQPLEDAVDIRRRRRFRGVTKPGERGGVEVDIVDETGIETAELLGRQRGDESLDC